jgi:hypothetical protein
LCGPQALEFLLWASICLELSVTLATTKFLPWKTTLYCAVCQCHYDSGAPRKAEVERTLTNDSELGLAIARYLTIQFDSIL